MRTRSHFAPELVERLYRASLQLEMDAARPFMIEVLKELPNPVSDAAARGVEVASAYARGDASVADLEAARAQLWKAYPASSTDLSPRTCAAHSAMFALFPDWTPPREMHLETFADFAIRAGVPPERIDMLSRRLGSSIA